MSILDRDFGVREITTELLKSLGFKEALGSFMSDGIRYYPFDLFIKFQQYGVDKFHHIRYIPHESKVIVKENADYWSCKKEYTIQVASFDDICVIVKQYN